MTSASEREDHLVRAVDLFAGAGGWDVAALELGVDTIGVENDDAAVATRAAAQLRPRRGTRAPPYRPGPLVHDQG
jgi:hypothetical protein